MGIFYALAGGSKTLLWIILIGVVVIGVLLGGYWFVLKWLRNRKGEKMSAALGQHNTAAPTSISDPGARARLDDLRKNFSEGVEKFKAAGKDIYSLPWYCLVGEPGSGKTEAVRHSNIGFPPGLQDECQGVGGTINMNWWFTNQAVILDTAGRLLFEDLVPGSTNEWKEFLKLLNKNRPNQPINGLLLTIPADSLIRDTAEEIEKKAGKIALQLDDIQRILDIRFPVFVIITKSDLIHGFREFFENLTDPELQHQMLGWSNPDELDVPFRPELIDQFLQDLIKCLEKRRLGLVQDPTAQEADKKRIDEVDSLFAFPYTLQSLFARLRRYMEMIFVAGEWSQKPLFLRGIYFTSSMQEGTAMDQDLANALGLSVDDLPEERAWEREKAYFLRDAYTQKVFKEKYLVTRATNTKKLLRRQQLMIFGIGFAALFIILGFSWYGAGALKRSIGEQRSYWLKAGDPPNWNNGLWSPRIVSPRGDGTYSNNQKASIEIEGNETNLVAYHSKLKDLAREEIKIPVVFKPLQIVSGALASKTFDRKNSQRIVFEGGVLKPLIFSTRDKMNSPEDDMWTPEANQALISLIRLEGAVIQSNLDNRPEVDDIKPLIDPLMRFLTEEEANPKLDDILEWTYSRRGAGRKYWPPSWLSAGLTLKENAPINAGIVKFLDFARESLKVTEAKLNLIRELREDLFDLRNKEKQLANTIKINAEDSAFLENVKADYDGYVSAKEQLIMSLAKAKEEKIITTEDALPLSSAYAFQVEKAKDSIDGTLNEISKIVDMKVDTFSISDDSLGGESIDSYTEARKKLIEEQQKRLEDRLMDEDLTLFLDIKEKLGKERKRLQQSIQSVLSKEEVEELKVLDDLFLVNYENEERAIYEVRAELYKDIFEQLTLELEENTNLIGRFSKNFEKINSDIERLQKRVENYEGSDDKDFRSACTTVLEQAKAERLNDLTNSYLKEVNTQLDTKVSFPLIFPYEGSAIDWEGLEEVQQTIRLIRKDLDEDVLDQLAGNAKPLRDLLLRLTEIETVEKMLTSADDTPINCKISLLGFDDHKKTLQDLIGEASILYAIDKWRVIQLNSLDLKSSDQVSDLGTVAIDEKTLKFVFYFSADSKDSKHEVDFSGDWAPLRFIYDSENKVSFEDGGKSWHVAFSVPSQSGDQSRYVLIKIEFENALPESSQDWPTRETLELDN